MPTFSIVSLREAREGSASGKRAELLQEYIGYIQRVSQGEAGVLEPGEGETPQAIRRRLNTAVETLGKRLDIRRSGRIVYFWPSEGRRRGQAAQEPG